MSDIKINQQKLEKKSPVQFSGYNTSGTFYKKGEHLLCKFLDTNFFIDEVERNIDYLISHHVPHTAVIDDKLYIKKKFSGYSMEYLKNTITFRRATSKKISNELKISAIMDIYETIRYLHHHHICFGDVHLDNFLISADGKGYVIDLDYLAFPGDELKFQQLYCIQKKHDTPYLNEVTPYTDNVKMVISSLSLFMEIDLEKMFVKDGCICLEDIAVFLHQYYSDYELDQYFQQLIYQDEVIYFDDFLKNHQNLVDISNKQFKR